MTCPPMSPKPTNCYVVSADAGYTGVEKREERTGRQVIWQVAARPYQTQSTVQSQAQDREGQGAGTGQG